jgi:hypothetical protein
MYAPPISRFDFSRRKQRKRPTAAPVREASPFVGFAIAFPISLMLWVLVLSVLT